MQQNSPRSGCSKRSSLIRDFLFDFILQQIIYMYNLLRWNSPDYHLDYSILEIQGSKGLFTMFKANFINCSLLPMMQL